MPQAPAAPVILSLAQPCPLPVICMLTMVASRHPGHHGSHKGSST